MKPIRAAFSAFCAAIDRRDVTGAVGLALLWFGGERLYPGAGITAAGAVLAAIAIWVR